MAILGKKGVFLTFIALSMVGIFVLFFTPTSIVLETNQASTNRIVQLSDVVQDIEQSYVPQSLDASTTKTLYALTRYMEIQNTFLNDFDAAFNEVLLNGTIGASSIDTIIGETVMHNATFTDMVSHVEQAVDNAFSTTSSIQIVSINAHQIDPWHVSVDATIDFVLDSETADWNSTFVARASVPITRFMDPLYSVNTQGATTNRINKTLHLSTQWDEVAVRNHTNWGTYVHFEGSNAPSFLMRFENNTNSSSCCGIESLVNPNDLAVADQQESYVDYLFFGHVHQDCSQLFNITGIWDQFDRIKVDASHIFLYNLTQTTYVSTC